MSKIVTEREITEAVSLCLPNGKLNPDAIGWTRTPLHDTSGIGAGHVAWGRNKRWEYWAVTTPSHILSLTVSSLDYAAVHAILVYERASGRVIDRSTVSPFSTSATLPPSLTEGPARARTRDLTIDIDEVAGGTRLRGSTTGVKFEVNAERPQGHEALAVVVPWSERRFQYTVKDVARPASGWLEVDGIRVEIPVGESWAVLDHGRGRWPYRVTWNWGAASGTQDGQVIGLQIGGQWTNGTNSTENALVIDGRLHKISEELDWTYDESDWLSPWRISGSLVELRFEPFWDRVSHTELLILGSRGHQCFGHYTGWVEISEGKRVEITGLLGWAEDVRNRW